MYQVLAFFGLCYSLWVNPAVQENPIKDFFWLEGNWCGQTDGGQGFCEQWKKLENGNLFGQGYFFLHESKKDTSFQENMELLAENNQLLYRVRLEKSSAPVDFVIKSHSAESFVCENMANDFPKSIHYKRIGRKLLITLKGSQQDKEINFNLSLQDEKGKN
jgi:hypothetical protein